MESTDLTREQLESLIARARQSSSYLSKLGRRMDELQFPEDDRLQLVTAEAFRASQAMFNLLHELTCNGAYGQGRKAK